MLSDIWADRGQLAGKGSNPIYSMYNAVTEANPLKSTSTKAYLGNLASIAQRRPPGANSNA
ncbi:MAG: hypothetical protein GY822_06350 [Deltaproteobacteria bacterium]|nr:hypothetical protein [Deltaproteobacteria bacterium]